MRAGGAPCAATLEHGEDTEGDGFTLLVSFSCAEVRGPIEVEMRLLDRLARDHRHAVQLTDGESSVQKILSRSDRFVALERAGSGPTAEASVEGAPQSVGSVAGAVTMGLEHILTGWDHVLFLAVLLPARAAARRPLGRLRSRWRTRRRWRWRPTGSTRRARCVEPAIAASIAFVCLGTRRAARGTGAGRSPSPSGWCRLRLRRRAP